MTHTLFMHRRLPTCLCFRILADFSDDESLLAASKLLSEARDQIRSRHFSRRTETSYVYWIRQFIRHNRMRHPDEMGSAEISRFLSHLALERNVAPNTQKVALHALIFLYVQVLKRSNLKIDQYRLADKDSVEKLIDCAGLFSP